MKVPANAIIGIPLWIAAWLWLSPPLVVGLLLGGPFVAVPLALHLIGAPRNGPTWDNAWRALQWAQLPAAVTVAIAFRFEAGLAAALWTLPWLAFAGVAALAGLVRVIGHRGRPLGELAIDAALAFLLVGGFWLTVSRWGQPVAGFGDPIALLTAAHFNVAGVVVPVAAGLCARRLPGPLATATAVVAITGMPAVAVGITLQQQGIEIVNAVAVAYFALGMLGLSLLHAHLAKEAGSPGSARLLWAISAASLPIGMALAVVYATGPLTGYGLTIDQMARSHAIVNLFGFALAAMLAWTLASPGPQPLPGRPTAATG